MIEEIGKINLKLIFHVTSLNFSFFKNRLQNPHTILVQFMIEMSLSSCRQGDVNALSNSDIVKRNK